MSIKGRVDKEDIVYTYNEILLRLLKQGKFDTCYNMDEFWRHYTKWNKTRGHFTKYKKTNTLLFHLYEVPTVLKFIVTENKMIGAIAKGERNVHLLFGVYRVWEDKKKNFWKWIVLMITQQFKYS